MAICDILDVRCIMVNEIVGSAFLSVIIGLIFYFIIASKLRLGFDTTISFLLPIMLIGGLMFTGFSAIFAFATVIVSLLFAWALNIVLGNR